ncbi:hypothetical protein [Mucilaginibacter gotjawali]|uniref:Uncharacterized protein n=2 Tax=Mucilaginibacter gotjawali TaxID=1550579 RepID=A0A0X8X2A5_9SPHI|nr:hypothetical protein [Mucilaginibacter gotjawali]MBB3054163.1 tetratricopeptide (TPR) repeat protein [Mucilaginibacter gotjawali]BAU54434.1 hypothetical protein MgSA37_02610 [Mucilaginibacter gotjawali]
MRKVFTLIFLLTALRLSAAAFQPDTLKTSGTAHSADSIKKAPAKAESDSVKTAPATQKQDSAKIPTDHKADPVKTIPASSVADSLQSNVFTGTVDSLITVMAQHSSDSSKTITGINKNERLKLSASLPPVNSPGSEERKLKTPENPELQAPAPEANVNDALFPYENLRRVTSLIQLDSLRATILVEQARQARLQKIMLRNEQLKIAELLKINNLDSLKQELSITKSDTLKAVLNTRIALKYLDYDTIASKTKRYEHQNLAIEYTLQAIRQYSIYNDSIGLRICYDNLAKVYHAQKKFAQAKWFILQSNTLSRTKNDTPNIIISLLTLAAIKSDIKDYTLAMGDLDEALKLSISTHAPKTQIEVLKNYAQLYNLLQNYPKEAAVLKKRDALLDSIHKSDEALLAKIAALKKKQELQQAKKKLLSAATRKPSKNSSPVKIASL